MCNFGFALAPGLIAHNVLIRSNAMYERDSCLAILTSKQFKTKRQTREGAYQLFSLEADNANSSSLEVADPGVFS